MSLSEFAYEKLNDDRLIAKRDEWFERLRAIFSGCAPSEAFAVTGFYGALPLGWLNFSADIDPEQYVSETLENLAKRADEVDSDTMFMPPCIECGPYGVHYIDSILGAEVKFADNQWYNKYLKHPVGELVKPNIYESDTFLLSLNVAKAFVKSNVKLPLYGEPTLSSPLNIAVNLYGADFLVSLLTEPEAAEHDLRVITDVIKEAHSAFISTIPQRQLQPVIAYQRTQPPGHGQVCGCTTQLVSSEVYRDMILPLDEEILSLYAEGGMIHLCGSHTQHIENFRSMKSLHAVQLNDAAAADLEKYFHELRDDQVIYLNPCKEMTIERALKVTNGRKLIIADVLDKPRKLTCGREK